MASHSGALRSSTPGRRSVGMEGGAARAQGYRGGVQQQQVGGMASPRATAGPVAILWDIENCPVPVEVNAEDVAGNIRIALREHPHIGAVTMFSAYGDFNHFPKKVREGCQRTGVNLIDVPNGKKDAADKAILVDMFLFALDNPPPSTIFLVTGDVDFAPALHKLGQRGYVVVLVIPDGVGVSPALRGAGRYVWDWPSLCRGHGLVEVPSVRRRFPEPQPQQQQPLPPTINTTPASDDDDHVQGEEILVQRKVPYPFVDHHGHQGFATYRRNVTATSPSIRHYPRAPFPTPDADLGFANSDAAEPTSPGGGGNWVQPGDLAGLKKQLVRLVTSHGGKMTLVKVPAEYQKQYGRPLYLAEYNVLKLVHLVEKMKDALVLKGDGASRTLHLVEKERVKGHNKYKPASRRPSAPKDSEDSDPEVKETIKAELAAPEAVSKRHLMDMDMDEVKPAVLAALPSDWESVTDVKAKLDPVKTETVIDVGEVCEAEDYKEDPKLARFKHDLQALLVLYSCNIPLQSFVEWYVQRYAQPLDLHSFGVASLEALFQKVKDVAVLEEKTAGKGDAQVVYVVAV